jgi:S-adenosylmethionine/arginine decarboxylase-like enzyme
LSHYHESIRMTTLPKKLALPADEVNAFGRSLHIDLYGVRAELCDDLAFCYQLLDDLVNWLGMHKQSPPFLFRSPDGEYPDKAGLSGWVPLIESGISLHTLTVKQFVTIDIYTCGCLDAAAALRFLQDRLQPTGQESHYLVRGTTYHE